MNWISRHKIRVRYKRVKTWLYYLFHPGMQGVHRRQVILLGAYATHLELINKKFEEGTRRDTIRAVDVVMNSMWIDMPHLRIPAVKGLRIDQLGCDLEPQLAMPEITSFDIDIRELRLKYRIPDCINLNKFTLDSRFECGLEAEMCIHIGGEIWRMISKELIEGVSTKDD